jgi:hypothetical protein
MSQRLVRQSARALCFFLLPFSFFGHPSVRQSQHFQVDELFFTFGLKLSSILLRDMLVQVHSAQMFSTLGEFEIRRIPPGLDKQLKDSATLGSN